MLSHVHIGTNDFDRSLAFYNAVMPLLGWRRRFIDRTRPWAGWQPGDQERPLLLVGSPFDDQPASPGNGQMTALLAPSRAAVDQFYTVALAHGGRSEGEPGLRPEYHAKYYGAYLRDPAGNKLCVCHHGGA
ncbi:VOC family protein [Niveispirillum sp. KHB5.9]|uniref:VOC family protein n=1 Tax=Niveispirillum sp. KHB5.9 TaxID=3400269 RepID=UPI003A83C287